VPNAAAEITTAIKDPRRFTDALPCLPETAPTVPEWLALCQADKMLESLGTSHSPLTRDR